MTSIEKLNLKLKSIEDQRKAIFEQIHPLQEKAVALYEESQKINEEITKETMKQEQSEQERFDFVMAETGAGVDSLRYNEANKLIQSFGLFMTGYCPFSQQRTANVFFFKFDDERNAQSIDSMKKLITLFKPMDEEGNKQFRVFCQDSVVFAHPDGTFSLRSRYDRKDFETLELLFAHYVAHCTCYDEEEDTDYNQD